MKRFLYFLAIAVLLAGLWLLRGQILTAFRMAESNILPCQSPVPYALNSFDNRFSINRADFLSAVNEAANIWDQAAGRKLFVYDGAQTPGDLMLNLVYDDRQAATDRLKSLGLAIDDTRRTYDTLDAQYNSLKASYDGEKASLDAAVTAYNKEKADYENQVAYWNARGGAPADIYNQLETERQNLMTGAQGIQAAQNKLNSAADNINALVVVLNRIAADLNINASNYNRLGTGEFEEGLYEVSRTGREIDIYQFDNQAKLVRVLAHEMGHALGLNHVDDPQAIMYRLNQGQNQKPTAADIAELKARCGLK